ncbi:NUDIX hydrolase [Solibacillus sp. FSL K6-1781]|uniref:NTP pyrophosphohydrolase including oxidative damage repair enzyme n=1 Tax=Solibacillus silvestris (strain StLB046) TaxID=1002809 RepID=F2F1H2_SOLSS|nr:NUDIX hydrolase [Solibacillus silvestris]BAK15310.1 NTP pyrophosphohydrolase including oxidative damage repair enzyme [Solibacillus silvestris StLB046]
MQYKLWNGASAIIIRDNRVLMIRTIDSNSWSIPSGGVEDGETVEEACIREVAEETGYEVKIVKELHTKKTIIKEYKVTTKYFLCEITGGDIQYNDPDEEIEEITWMNRNEISKLIYTYPEDQEVIEQLLSS